jgi:hypothetical protein
MMGLIDEKRERRLRNLSGAVGAGLNEEVKWNKYSLTKNLSEDFDRVITMAERCVYLDDFHGALYHGFVADMIHRALKELEFA